ncbi:MAG: peptidoglycan DD-metalloendopeptidase family protein, partial [Dehalococcoidia bacterium]|nr:peptidoglycan DD-metalloendopeptidase family protein [Dehalococcoidia bacterium]
MTVILFALMHLKRGSLLVQPGDVVQAGAPLAQVGNTGNTTQPHLHFQLMDAPTPWNAGGLVAAFSHYEVREGSP